MLATLHDSSARERSPLCSTVHCLWHGDHFGRGDQLRRFSVALKGATQFPFKMYATSRISPGL